MNWYVLIKGEVKAQHLNKKQAFDICEKFHKENPEIDACRILICRKIRRNDVEMYNKMCYNEFSEDGVYYGT